MTERRRGFIEGLCTYGSLFLLTASYWNWKLVTTWQYLALIVAFLAADRLVVYARNRRRDILDAEKRLMGRNGPFVRDNDHYLGQ